MLLYPPDVKDPKMELPVTLSLQKVPLSPKQNHPKECNSTIKHHTKLKDDHAILTTYTQMASLGITPDSTTLPLVLKACARLNAVREWQEHTFWYSGYEFNRRCSSRDRSGGFLRKMRVY
ncbi:hypothetical protein FH972_009774 [Carpinus fangiana]|uniref:Uncharacterized protein n=1 Tax=Carpinus fangiana TaxID=176857 RepID=A0A660KN75_9ROSI|nr:hypothetical protein FH972_009774 [Carpinus fangiana]